jgi:hypothetical protein
MIKVYYPGVLMIPMVLLALTLLSFATAAAGPAAGPRVWSYWPVTLIATGLEELYLWATSRRIR